MDFTYFPRTLADGRIIAEVEDSGPSIEVEAGDMDRIKAFARQGLAGMKPTSRIELLARAFGFRTAAALQAAVAAGSREAPALLTPRIGELDDYRLDRARLLPKEDRVAARDAAHRCVAHLIEARGASSEVSWDAPESRDHRGFVRALPGRECRHVPELCIPSLATLIGRASNAVDEDGWAPEPFPKGARIELLDSEIFAPTPEEWSRLKVGVVPPQPRPESATMLADPEVSDERFRGTLVYRDPSGRLDGAITFRVDLEPIPTRDAEEDVSETYDGTNLDQDALDFFVPSVRARYWDLKVTVEQDATPEWRSLGGIEEWGAIHDALLGRIRRVPGPSRGVGDPRRDHEGGRLPSHPPGP